jgi:hypothetical protein
MDPDPALFIGGFQDVNEKFEVHLHQSSKTKSQRSYKTVSQGFSYFFA